MQPFIPIPSLRDPESLQSSANMTALASAMAATEEIATFAVTGWLPDRFFALLAEFYAVYDTYIRHNISASKLTIRCKSGCGGCCRQAVHGVYSFEIINLYRLLRPLPDYPRIHNEFVKRGDGFQRLLISFAENAANAGASDQDALVFAMRKFAAAGESCPLLVENSCSIYTHRPVPCRMYHSLTDPILCVTPIGHTFNLEPPEAANRMLWELSERLAFPFSNFLAQGLVAFAFRRQFRPWAAPLATALAKN